MRRRTISLLVSTLAVLDAGWPVVRQPLQRVADTALSDEGDGLATLAYADALLALCAGAVTVSGTWLAVTTALFCASCLLREGLHGAQHARPSPLGITASVIEAATARLCPVAVRRALVAVCGVALATGAVQGAAGTEGSRRAPSQGPPPAHMLSGLAMPDRVTADTRHRRPGGRGSVAATALAGTGPEEAPHGSVAGRRETVSVHRGDSLWVIAQRLLPSDAGPADITTAWKAVYRLNRAVVGPDPDRIFPGTVLAVPPRLVDRKALP
jgi:hypothetical protein